MSNTGQIHDYIVVGSGLTGAMAAQTLCEAGAGVLMLDVAYRNKTGLEFPSDDFISLRKNSASQHHMFLGKDYSGIPWGAIKTGAQLTPGRKYIVQEVEKWIPMLSDTFKPMESLAYGGLGNAWGAGCYIFSESEFQKMGILKSEFEESYQTVSNRIGISAANDDAMPYTVHGLKNVLPAIIPEKSIQNIVQSYQRQRSKFQQRGFHVGLPAVATLTKDMGERKALAYSDMDFWHDNDQSVYRPWMTVDALLKQSNFRLEERMLVVKFEEQGDLIKVHAKHTETNEEHIFTCRKLVLCSGVLGTARIALRSFERKQELPLLCNPYLYVPMLQLRTLGRATEQRKSGMGQLVMFYDKQRDNSDVAMAAFFTYRSLLLMRLIKESPFNFAASRALMQYIVPSMVIAGIHHPESTGSHKLLRLQPSSKTPTGDILEAQYVLNSDELKEVERTEKEFFKSFLSLGCIPIQKVQPGHGASIHYAGTLPYNSNGYAYTTSHRGLLSGTKNVYVADGSSFHYLPAKGISFTLMANADRVARKALGGA